MPDLADLSTWPKWCNYGKTRMASSECTNQSFIQSIAVSASSLVIFWIQSQYDPNFSTINPRDTTEAFPGEAIVFLL